MVTLLLLLACQDREGVDFFEQKIRPVLAERCYKCHSVKAEKLKGDLRLDSREGLLKGGESGAILVPGDPDKSRLIVALRHADADLKMPPKEKLPAAQVADFEAWVRRGAPIPPTYKAAAKAPPWSLQPAWNGPLPEIKAKDWVRTPIDRFILAKLEEKGLKPSPEADRRTLLRRVTFDLTGLPPAEDAPYEDAVDRLLASPACGERWGRHWLDTVHFGETHGYDKDKPRANAWPYRDYVIRALNDDKPYSRFVEEQLAGDVLFPDDPDGIVALGFIAAGPWDFVGHAELPETKTDGLIARYNDRDDMLMTAISTFQSLTVHCARCHDHKFDPIPQEEYYGLQAVFAGVDRADRAYDPDPALHRKRRDLEARAAGIKARLAGLTSPEIRDIDARLAVLPSGSAKSRTNGYHSNIEPTPDAAKWVQVDLGKAVAIDEVRLVPARPTDFPDTPGFGFPPRFKVELDDEAIADHTGADFANPGDTAVVLKPGREARVVRVTATRLWKRTGDYAFALAELQVFSAGQNVALGAAVTAQDSIEAGRWSKAHLVDGHSSRAPLDDSAGERRKLEERRAALVETLTDEADRRDLAELAKLPAPRKVYAAASSFAPQGTFLPPPGPRPVNVLVRGDVKRPARPAVPGALSCVPGPTFECADASQEGARRAALAKWITDRRNILTRRSIVNRVWHYHFGRGLVETPNDFGHMGALPSHPELLAWLARWFVENGESLKKLHRLIVTSAVYRQSSASNAEGARADADNRLLWRMSRARLDAEEFRDALLFAAGTLDPTVGGPSDRQFFFKDDHSPVYDYARFDVDSAAGRRRSVYRFVVRSVPDPFMDTLDGADPSILTPRRNTTLTALQALATLNNPFVVRQSEHLARRAGDVAGLYRLLLGRAPTADESKLLGDYAARHGLANAARVLVNSNEFMFVD